ncbi:MAG TPA: hypothetical protein VGQ83_21895 [Polyangia bacterium]
MRKWAPARTGESRSTSSETGRKVVVSPAARAVSRAVPSFQPCGTRTLGA